MKIILVAAITKDNVIGFNGGMPWSLPADLQHFRRITMGKPVVMGRKTAETIGKPLSGRQNIVLSTREDFQMSGFTVVHSIDEAAIKAEGAKELMIIGGAEVYRQFMPWADEMHITLVHGSFPGDTFFPEFDWNNWEIVSCTKHPGDADNTPHDIYHLKR